MSKLIERGILDVEQPLADFIKANIEEMLKKINESDWPSSIKQSRATLLGSFYKCAQKKKIKQTKDTTPFERYRSLKNVAVSELLICELLSESLSSNEDKSQRLTDRQLERFFREIREVNERDFLLCWTMWNLKCTIHQVLNFKVGDYDSALGIFKISEDDFRLGEIRPELKELILKQCEGKRHSDLIFATNKGKGIHPGQIVRNMKIACKRAKLPIIISPKILYARALEHGKNEFSTMSKDEVEALSRQYSKKITHIVKNSNFVFEKKA